MDRQPRETAQPPSPTAASDSRFAQHHRAPGAALKVARRPWQEPARDRGYFGKRENRPVARFELLSQARFLWSPTLPQQSVPPYPPALPRLSHYSPATSVRTRGRASKLRNGLIRRAEQHFIAAGARQIIENVTGFFSILHECRVPKIPAPGMIAGSDWRRCGMARRGCRLRKLGRSAVAALRAGRAHVGAQFDERDRYRR